MRWTMAVAAASLAFVAAPLGSDEPKPKTWGIKADAIEACSCHLMCCCYFQNRPEGGKMCKFNSAMQVSEGHVGETKVDGARFWLSGDLGGDFSQGKMKEGVLTFDPALTPEQCEAIVFLVKKLFPVEWGSFATDSAPIAWEMTDDGARARLGEIAEVSLTPVHDGTGKQTVIHNLTYWGAQRNGGFHLAQGTHRYQGHGLDYAFQDHNGFTIRVESEGVLEAGKQ